MSAQGSRTNLATAVAAWNRGDGDAYLELYDPSIIHHTASLRLDHETNRQFYETVWAAFPGSQLTIDDTICEVDKLAARFRVAGEHKGEFMGVPATGRSIMWNGQTVMRFRDNRVVERWTLSDLLGLLTQLGAIPASGR